MRRVITFMAILGIGYFGIAQSNEPVKINFVVGDTITLNKGSFNGTFSHVFMAPNPLSKKRTHVTSNQFQNTKHIIKKIETTKEGDIIITTGMPEAAEAWNVYIDYRKALASEEIFAKVF